MIIKQLGTNWFKGTAGKLVFFADTKGGVMDKYRIYLEKNPPVQKVKPLDPQRVAAKIIRFEDYLNQTVWPGAA